MSRSRFNMAYTMGWIWRIGDFLERRRRNGDLGMAAMVNSRPDSNVESSSSLQLRHTGKFFAVMADAISQQAASMTYFDLLGHTFPVSYAKTQVSILKGGGRMGIWVTLKHVFSSLSLCIGCGLPLYTYPAFWSVHKFTGCKEVKVKYWMEAMVNSRPDSNGGKFFVTAVKAYQLLSLTLYLSRLHQ
ncbi:hypothetical protein Tco_1249594 [Tanacetum coccineum]